MSRKEVNSTINLPKPIPVPLPIGSVPIKVKTDAKINVLKKKSDTEAVNETLPSADSGEKKSNRKNVTNVKLPLDSDVKSIKPKKIKHIKILKDNINCISVGDITRLARKGGVSTMSKSCIPDIRDIIQRHMEKVLKGATIFTSNKKHQVVQSDDIRQSLNIMGRFPMYYDGKEVKRYVGDKSNGQQIKRVVKSHPRSVTTNCKLYHSKRRMKDIHIGGGLVDEGGNGMIGDGLMTGGAIDDDLEEEYLPEEEYTTEDLLEPEDESLYPVDDDDDENNDNAYDDLSTEVIEDESTEPTSDEFPFEDQSGGTKKYKYKPGTVAKRQVTYYQKQPGRCFNIRKSPFHRLAREIAQGYANNLKFSKEAFIMLQLDTENYIVNLFNKANKLVTTNKRIRVMPKDIKLVILLSDNNIMV